MFYIRFKKEDEIIHCSTLHNNVADYINVIKSADEILIEEDLYKLSSISFKPAGFSEEVDCVDVWVY